MTGSPAIAKLSSVKVLAARILRRFHARSSIVAAAISPEEANSLASRLLSEKQALFDFTVGMENEFLELGDLLRRVAALAREVRDRSGDVMDAVSGRSEDAPVEFAFHLLKKAEDVVAAAHEQHKNVFAVFQRIRDDLALLVRERNRLIRTLAPLESTNVQFRIQACPFDPDTRARFFALAETIGSIVRDTRDAVGQRFDDLERMGKSTGQLIARLSAMAEGRKLETESLLDRTREDLSELNGALLKSERESQTISQVGARISAGVGKAIVGLQCQDMARQKFEHINAAIDDMELHLDGTLDAECRTFLAGAGLVQLRQLKAVFDQLEGAARGLETGLREVESESSAFAEYSVRSGGATLDGRMIGRAVGSIQGVLRVIDGAIDGIDSVSQIVGNLQLTFADCRSEIPALAIRLRMTALNAQIFAAHLDRGMALEVVAQNTRTVADGAMENLDRISRNVTDLADLVTVLELQTADYRGLAEAERKLLAGEARESEGKLSALETELRAAVAAIGPLEKELCAVVAQASARIRFPAAVTAARNRSTALFERIVNDYSDSGASSHTPAGGAAREKLETLKNNYTMEHERRIHDAAVGAPTNDRTQLMNGDTDETIADNTELF